MTLRAWSRWTVVESSSGPILLLAASADSRGPRVDIGGRGLHLGQPVQVQPIGTEPDVEMGAQARPGLGRKGRPGRVDLVDRQRLLRTDGLGRRPAAAARPAQYGVVASMAS